MNFVSVVLGFSLVFSLVFCLGITVGMTKQKEDDTERVVKGMTELCKDIPENASLVWGKNVANCRLLLKDAK